MSVSDWSAPNTSDLNIKHDDLWSSATSLCADLVCRKQNSKLTFLQKLYQDVVHLQFSKYDAMLLASDTLLLCNYPCKDVDISNATM